MRPRILGTLVACAIFGGCAANFRSDELWDRLHDEQPVIELSGERKTLRLPMRLGIAPPLRADHSWRRGAKGSFGWWRAGERRAIETWIAKFEKEGLVRESIFLPRMVVANKGKGALLDGVRKAARATGVDAVLVINAMSDVRQRPNPLVILDVTIVGTAIFPAHEAFAATVLEGILLDPHANAFYAVATGEGRASATTPWAFVDKDAVADESTLAALDSLGEDLFKQAAKARRGRNRVEPIHARK